MPFSYSPLWKQLIDKKLTKEDIRTTLNISPATIAKMGKDKYVSLEVLDRICTLLDCEIEDVIKHQK